MGALQPRVGERLSVLMWLFLGFYEFSRLSVLGITVVLLLIVYF